MTSKIRLSSLSIVVVLLVAVEFFMIGAVAASASATEKLLLNFSPYVHGVQPNGDLISDAAGNLYGVAWIGAGAGVGGVYRLSPNSHGGWTETVIYSFPYGPVSNPQGAVVFDSTGNLYGTTGDGSIFKLTPSVAGPWTETVIYKFSGPPSGLGFDNAGNLYGVTASGGTKGCGRVFRLAPATGKWTENDIYSFLCGSDGSSPYGGPIFDQSGHLYGTADSGGANGEGVVYELTKSSNGNWSEQVLYSFLGGAAGEAPGGQLTFDQAGNLYGVAAGGTGTGCFGNPCGIVFQLTPGSNGTWTENKLHDFNWTDGAYPADRLVVDQDGNVYGTTSRGGTADSGNGGVAFQLVPGLGGQWTENVLWNFIGGKDGAGPNYSVILGPAGQLYGAAASGGGTNGNGTVFELTSTRSGMWKETTLTNFADGNGAPAELTSDGSGNFYGATDVGGAYGFGAICKFSPKTSGGWQITIVYNFTTGILSNGHGLGASPSKLVFDAAGNLYGETAYGGPSGNGNVFELSPAGNGAWTESELYDFAGSKDGANPYGGLAFDGNGNLYGTTKIGGNGPSCQRGCGTVFELSPSAGGWSKTILYNFAGGLNDGSNPVGGVTLDQAGNLYGTTLAGGTSSGQNNCGTGCGTMFELSPSTGGWKETFLHLFLETHGDGGLPYAGLIFDAQGNLYGTTSTGGSHSGNCGHGCGTVFEFSPASGGGWAETVIYAFPGPSSGPLADVFMDSAGNLYGTTTGSVFELSPTAGGWTETDLHIFGGLGSGDGNYADGSVFVDGSGNVYGATANGGSADGGTLFEITP